MYGHVGGHLFTELELLTKNVISSAGLFQDLCSRRSYTKKMFIFPIPNRPALVALGYLLFKVSCSSAFEFSSPSITTRSMFVS